MSETQYSPDIIRRYRELNDAEGFRRKIVERQPLTLSQDSVRLECGHEQKSESKMIDLAAKMWGGVQCQQCVDEWLKKAREQHG